MGLKDIATQCHECAICNKWYGAAQKVRLFIMRTSWVVKDIICYSRRFPPQIIFVADLISELCHLPAICVRSVSVIMSTSLLLGVDLNDDQSPQLIKSVVACCVLSGLALAGRLASRKIKKSDFMASDYLVTAGLVGSWVISGLIIDGEQSCFNSQHRHLILIPFSGYARPWQAY